MMPDKKIKNYLEPAAWPGEILFSVCVPAMIVLYPVIKKAEWWVMLICWIFALVLGAAAMEYANTPKKRALRAYREYLGQWSLADLVVFANDPATPKRTENLVRAFLDEKYPNWHKNIVLKTESTSQDAAE